MPRAITPMRWFSVQLVETREIGPCREDTCRYLDSLATTRTLGNFCRFSKCTLKPPYHRCQECLDAERDTVTADIAVFWNGVDETYSVNVGCTGLQYSTVRVSETGFATEDQARAWAEAQRPRVESAWRVLTGAGARCY